MRPWSRRIRRTKLKSYARAGGVSLSDAVNDFLVKCVEKGELPFEATFGGNEPYGYPKPMDPKDVKVRIVGKVDEHGRTVLPAEEYCEEDDVYDELYPAP